ncbi:MAG: hypothetical protein GQ531_00665 [Sulfurovum sp.]|nr:hypothetical protein [Sulfurovum sp.]
MTQFKNNKVNTYDLNLIFSILLISLLPSFIFVAFNSTSLAAGILASSLFILLLNYKSLIGLRISLLTLSLFLIVVITLFITVSYFYIVESIPKPFYSMVILVVFLSAFVLAQKLLKINYQALSNSMLLVILVLLILGWLKLFFIPPCCHYDMFEKPVFPFSEESHYALVIGIIAVAYAFSGKLIWVFFIGVNILLLALLFPNLTLLVFSLLIFFASLFRLKPIYFKSFILLVPVLIMIIWTLFISNSEYFSSRLNFEDTKNLTTLVFLQGWDMAYLNLVETHGLGLGFQMLGSSATYFSSLTDEIVNIADNELNFSDGGLLAAKVIAEFGVIGIIVIVSYVYFLLKFIFYGNQIWLKIHLSHDQNYIQELKKKLFLSGILFGFLVEVFLRGYGYFSPGVFLALVAIFYLFSNSKMSRFKL